MKVEDIQQLASNYGIKLTENMTINDMGIDFQVVFAQDINNQNWVLRFPRRKELWKQIETEQNILSFLKKHYILEVPHWQIVTPDLIAYPLLDGEPVLIYDQTKQEVIWNIDKNSSQYITSLANALVKLHQLPQEEAKSFGIKSLSSDQIRQEVDDNIQIVKSELGINKQLEKRWIKWIDTDKLWPDFSTFIHGDFYAGHILTNENAEISGIIDWSEGQISDPTIDFAGHLAVFGEESLRTLIMHYEKLGGRVWDNFFEQTVERFSASPLTYAVFALKTKNEEHLNTAKVQLNS